MQEISYKTLLCTCFLLVKTRGYLLGSNVSLSFDHELSEPDSRILCSIFVSDRDQPLFMNEQAFASSFKPGQLERFGFHYERIQRNLTITLTISNLKVTDKGNYRVHILELVDGRVESVSEYAVIVTVTYPPGKAKCELSSNVSDPDWQTISCNATAGNDGSGDLVCLQNMKRLPLRGDLSTNGTYIVAVYYWIHPSLTVKCCSMESGDAVPLDTCDDVVFLRENVSATDQLSATNVRSTPEPSSRDTLTRDGGSNAHLVATIVLGILLGVTIVSGVIFMIHQKLKQCTRRHEGCACGGEYV